MKAEEQTIILYKLRGSRNSLPKRSHLGYGFNAQWAYSTEWIPTAQPADTRMLDFMAKYEFNFLRLPLDYRYWMPEITKEPLDSFLEILDK